jgi:preprotein translocase subunit SecB
MENSFEIIHLLLMESNFKREHNVTFNLTDENQKPIIEFDINSTINPETNEILVSETLSFKQIINGIDEISVVIKMLGAFKKYGEPAVSDEIFANINAAAILFPFIREHLSSLALKAGLGSVILSPVNFMQIYKDNQEKNKPELSKSDSIK